MSLIAYPELLEQADRRVLSNGLTLAVVSRPGFTKKLCYFVTDYGSITTEFTFGGEHHTVPPGVAHYLEHKLFDLPGRDVSGEFAALGAYVNAFTSYDMTAYYFSCTERFEDCLRLLLEFVSTPYFTEESVEKERGIIAQEIDMAEDDPESRVFQNLMTAMYRAHPIRTPILGSRESIGKITPEVLYLCHAAFYAPKNMMLCVVGDVDGDRTARIAEEVLGTARRPGGVKAPLPEEAMTCPLPTVTAAMEVSMPMFQLGFKAEPLEKGEDAARQEIVGDLAAEALFGESSPLYLRLYEAGLIDSSFGGGFETVDGMAMLTASGDADGAEQVRDAILDAARDIAARGVSPQDFERMKKSALGRRVRGLDSFEATCFRLCAYHFTGYDYFRFPSLYREVRREEIQEFLWRVVTPERCGLSVVTPIHEEAAS